MSDYPEHDKLAAVSGDTQAVGEFLTWLAAQGYVIARWKAGLAQDRLIPIGASVEELLAEWKDIDRNAIEREKRTMLAKLAELNAASSLRAEESRDPICGPQGPMEKPCIMPPGHDGEHFNGLFTWPVAS